MWAHIPPSPLLIHLEQSLEPDGSVLCSWDRLPLKVIFLWTCTCWGPSRADGVWKAWLINMFKYRRQFFLFAKQLLNIINRPAIDQENSYSLWFNTLKKWKIIKKPSNINVTAGSEKHLLVTIHKQSHQHIGRLKVTLPSSPHTVLIVCRKSSPFKENGSTREHILHQPSYISLSEPTCSFFSLYLTWIVGVMMSLTLHVSGAVLSS